MTAPALRMGIGWRPQLAMHIERYPRLDFIELLAENFFASGSVPSAVDVLRERGIRVIVHGVSLSLGGAGLPDKHRLSELNKLAKRVNAPFVSEHIAFVRAGGRDSGHLLPVPHTREMLEILAQNVRAAQHAMPVPLVLENIAALFEWPDAEMDEPTFLAELLEMTDTRLLLDISNLYANSLNRGFDPVKYLDKLPLGRLSYVHMAGGIKRKGFYHDTHAHPIAQPVLDLLRELCRRTPNPSVLLERDDHFPTQEELFNELHMIEDAITGGVTGRAASHV